MAGGVLGRLGAALRREQSVEPLLAYRRAGAAAHEWIQKAPAHWAGLAVSDADPWTAATPESMQLLCAWNAYVPQLVAEQLLEAEARSGTNRAGYLPAVSAEQAMRLFRAVEPWLTRSARAATDPRYRVDLDVRLPAGLPAWVEIEPCPPTHLQAMVAATRQLRSLVQVDLGNLRDLPATGRHAPAYDQLVMLSEESAAAVEYAGRLLHPGASTRVHAEVEARLKYALERQNHVGQLCALPALLTGYLTPSLPPRTSVWPSIPPPSGRDHWEDDGYDDGPAWRRWHD